MKKWMYCLSGLPLCLGGSPGGAASPAAPEPLAFTAGAAKVDITPAQATLEHGDVIHDRLYARALILANGKTCTVLVGLDQSGVNDAVMKEAAPQVARDTGCPMDQILIAGTHTHSGNTHGVPASGKPTGSEVARAVVEAVNQARQTMASARIGYGTTDVDLNVHRDQFDGTSWYQGTNRKGPSDKTLGVLSVIGADGMPIAIYMNYAMHPIDFYLSGQISADFPGEASGYIERVYPKSVAIFTQGASGDQNPRLTHAMLHLSGLRSNMSDAQNMAITAEDQWKVSARLDDAFAYQSAEVRKPLAPEKRAQYDAAVAEASDVGRAMGVLLGESALDVARNLTPTRYAQGIISAGVGTVSCPARKAIDPIRQGVLPRYADVADPVLLHVGVVGIAGIDLGWVDAEVYSRIGLHLRREAGQHPLMLVTQGNGHANSGYVPSNQEGANLSHQALDSRLKPGCAEDGIVRAEKAIWTRLHARP